jgi:malonyl CoA-acyl carrier protein transacylase
VAEALAAEAPPPEDLLSDSQAGIHYAEAVAETSDRLAVVFPGLGLQTRQLLQGRHLQEWALRVPRVRQVLDQVETRGVEGDPIPTSLLFFPPEGLSESITQRLMGRLDLPRNDEVKDHPAARNIASFGVMVVNQALWQVLQGLGVRPDLLAGHSVGEASALVAAGAMRFDDLVAAYLNAPAESQAHVRQGALAVVVGEPAALPALLEQYPSVKLAIEIGPGLRLFGGPKEALGEFVAALSNSGVTVRPLPYAAIHTPAFLPLRPFTRSLLQRCQVTPPALPVFGAQDATLYPASPDAIRERLVALMDRPLLMARTAAALGDTGVRLAVEIVDSGADYQSITAAGGLVTALEGGAEDAVTSLNTLAAELFVAGVGLDLGLLHRHRDSHAPALDLPALNLELTRPDRRPPVLPLLGEVEAYQPGRHLLARLRLDQGLQWLLRDHAFAAGSGVQPGWFALPVLPFTGALELMAEHAACLAPGLGLVAASEVRGMNWIRQLSPQGDDYRIEARRVEGEGGAGEVVVAVRIFEEGRTTDCFVGRLHFSDRYRNTLAMEYQPLGEPLPQPCDAQTLYQDRHLFHGPRFHAVAAMHQISANGVVGEVRVLPKGRLFRPQPQPPVAAGLADPGRGGAIVQPLGTDAGAIGGAGKD